tara:strand:+ start:1052 stop:1264 length:213 start_codon:yes stop_codon:yes gene_type:complete
MSLKALSAQTERIVGRKPYKKICCATQIKKTGTYRCREMTVGGGIKHWLGNVWGDNPGDSLVVHPITLYF